MQKGNYLLDCKVYCNYNSSVKYNEVAKATYYSYQENKNSWTHE